LATNGRWTTRADRSGARKRRCGPQALSDNVLYSFDCGLFRDPLFTGEVLVFDGANYTAVGKVLERPGKLDEGHAA
jgi:hypothetical protein